MGDRKSVRNIQDDGCLAILVQTGLLHYSYDFWKIIALKQKYYIQRKKGCSRNTFNLIAACFSQSSMLTQYLHHLSVDLSIHYKCWKSGPFSSSKINKNALYLNIHKWTFAHRLQNNKLKLKLAKLNWIKSY